MKHEETAANRSPKSLGGTSLKEVIRRVDEDWRKNHDGLSWCEWFAKAMSPFIKTENMSESKNEKWWEEEMGLPPKPQAGGSGEFSGLSCDLIATLTKTLYKALLCGNPTPHQEELLREMRNPQVGDLVLEMTTFRKYPSYQRMGRLKRKGRVWIVERIWSDGGEERWTNHEFIKILEP